MDGVDLEVIAGLFDYTISNEPLPSLKEELLEPLLERFHIAYLVGDSGNGKTTILEQLKQANERYMYLSVIDDKLVLAAQFSSNQEAVDRLTAAGLASILVWFRHYKHISAGEQARANIAVYLKSYTIIDEFTSNLDRLTARGLAYCVHKYIHKYNLRRVVLAGCNYDIIPWLQPDLVYDLNVQEYLPTYQTLPRWSCAIANVNTLVAKDVDQKQLCLVEVGLATWNSYAKHHYLSTSLLTNANCWEAFLTVERVKRAIGFT